MKLLSFSIPQNDQNIGFRSLKPGFEIIFHSDLNESTMTKFRPFCFAGLNGSGKSNVLEALANIFYHLEVMSARILPDSIRSQKNFKRNESPVDVFKLEYLIGLKNVPSDSIESLTKVTITKEFGLEPIMQIKPYPFDDGTEPSTILFEVGEESSAPTKIFLPDHIVGYSSGENELLSLPFIKSRFLQLDEYKEATKSNVREYKEPENSLIYIDNDMSQAVLLSCLLFENETTLAPLRDINNTGILDLRRFTIYLTYQKFDFQKKSENVFRILQGYQTRSDTTGELPKQIEKLKQCATCWYEDEDGISLDFYVCEATKDAFKAHFGSAFELFQVFHLFYILNNHFVDNRNVEDVYQSKGNYTDWKVPIGGPADDAFYFLKYYLIKEEKKSKKISDRLLRELSDGEHQFLHTTAICLMLKSKRTLLLLDEPETHFNPSWRAKFIKILNESIEASQHKKEGNVSRDEPRQHNGNIHLRKDILLTSHSPFIISDCMPDNVILFERNDDGAITAKKVSELDNAFNTYGTSVELILDKLFGYNQSIGDLSFSDIEAIDIESANSFEEIEGIKSKLRKLGESIEKDMVLSQLNTKIRNKRDAQNI
ncbi:restriction system-associated AAA family ATPase [uncultured Mucilaginibacter sp.]|uniref:restriction system-associated AAA family ATPase n=1 Tax=uncultured Mucilaginibacter sp. TaxID=797541 RepID=UPI0025CD78CA|nr:restriction system-associated AAA family ATPase [uncultured Mucilaginibacter sp.]